MNKSIDREIGDILQRRYDEETSNLFWDKIFTNENERKMSKTEDVSVVREIVFDAGDEAGCYLESYDELFELICAKYGIKY